MGSLNTWQKVPLGGIRLHQLALACKSDGDRQLAENSEFEAGFLFWKRAHACATMAQTLTIPIDELRKL